MSPQVSCLHAFHLANMPASSSLAGVVGPLDMSRSRVLRFCLAGWLGPAGGGATRLLIIWDKFFNTESQHAMWTRLVEAYITTLFLIEKEKKREDIKRVYTIFKMGLHCIGCNLDAWLCQWQTPSYIRVQRTSICSTNRACKKNRFETWIIWIRLQVGQYIQEKSWIKEG